MTTTHKTTTIHTTTTGTAATTLSRHSPSAARPSAPHRLFASLLLAAAASIACAPAGADSADGASAAKAAAPAPAKAKPVREKVVKNPPLDTTGRKRTGEASFYAREFAGKKMADGTPMKPESNNAASKTLPLGTKARVTNLENGKTAVVDIKDRGPYVKGRIVDLSPKTARQLGIGDDGVAPVEVAPIVVPQADGTVKAGEVVTEPAPAGNAPTTADASPLP